MRQVSITVLVTLDDHHLQPLAQRTGRPGDAGLMAAAERVRDDLECRVSDAVRSHNGVVAGAGIVTRASVITDQPDDLRSILTT